MADFMSINSTLEGSSAQARAMNRMYGLQRHFYDLSRAYYLLGRDDLIKALQPSETGTVLEMGCGTGRNLVAAAKQYPSAKFFGFDISTAMLETAGRAVQRNDLVGRVDLAQADASDFSATKTFGLEYFDRVFFSYTLSMVPAWQTAIEQGYKALKPGGELHIVDFGNCERLPAFLKAVLYAWLRRFHVTPRQDMGNWLQTLHTKTGAEVSIRPLFRCYAVAVKITKPPT
jgi:S-adenosylmethionine-diacylgycerolhomoserine-N-methlytransferase